MKHEKVHQIPIDSISDPREPIRSRYDSDALEGLARSIRDVGIITPLILRPCSEGYEVVVGHRRLAAARMAGRVVVPALIRRLPDFGTDVVRLHENLWREDVDPTDEAQFFARLLKQYNIGVDELAKKLHRSEAYIRSRLAIMDWDSVIQQAVAEKKVPFSAAKWLAKIKPESVRRDYLKYAIRGGITTSMAKAWYGASLKERLPSKPDSEALKEIPVEKRADYYKVECEICGKVIALGEQGVFMAHQQCIDDLKEVIARLEADSGPPATKPELEKQDGSPEAQ